MHRLFLKISLTILFLQGGFYLSRQEIPSPPKSIPLILIVIFSYLQKTWSPTLRTDPLLIFSALIMGYVLWQQERYLLAGSVVGMVKNPYSLFFLSLIHCFIIMSSERVSSLVYLNLINFLYMYSNV